jgi:4-amino-4-deoxy-L-arabinose transferase-like glycosyltransferase
MKRYPIWIVILLLTLLLILVYIFIIINYRLPPDTGYHYHIANQILKTEYFSFYDSYVFAGSENPYTPLFHILTSILSKTLNISIFKSINLLIIFFLVTLPFTIYFFSTVLIKGNFRIFIFLITSLSPAWLKLTYGRLPQMGAIVLVPLLFLSIYYSIKENSKKNIILSCLLLTSIILFHHLTGFIVCLTLFFIFLFYFFKDKKNFKKIIFIILIVTILVSPWLIKTFSYHFLTLKSQEKEIDFFNLRIEQSIYNPFSTTSEIQMSPLIFILIILSLSYFFTQLDFRKNKNYFLIILTVPLFFSFS